jgi:paired small multidrug resistance pump
MKTIPLSTVYAVWTGVGTVGAALVGMIFFREAKSLLRMFYIGGVILSVIGLRMFG